MVTKRYILPICILLICVSCGVAGRMSYREAYKTLESAMQTEDLAKVIEMYEEFPEYEDYILSYLYNDYSCKNTDYSFLSQMSGIHAQDTLLYNALMYLMVKQECLIDEELREIDIEDIGTYYIAKIGDRQYLDRTFSENLTPVWRACDYYTLKKFHISLAETSWQDSVDVYYLPLRDTLMNELLIQIDMAYAYEDSLISSLSELFLYEYDVYLQKSTKKLVQMCFDKKMPLFKSNLRSRVDDMLVQCYDDEKISETVMSYMLDVYPTLNENIEQIFKIFPSLSQKEIDSFMLDTQNFVYDFPYISYYPFERLRSIQRQINWVSLGLTTASFLVVFPFDIVIDAADMAYSNRREKTQVEKIQSSLSEISQTMYREYTKDFEKDITEYLEKVRKYLKQNYIDIKSYVYENF